MSYTAEQYRHAADIRAAQGQVALALMLREAARMREALDRIQAAVRTAQREEP